MDQGGWVRCYLGRCIFTFGHDMLSRWWKSTLSIALMKMSILCAMLTSLDTVRAVFDATRELEHEVVDLVVKLMIEAI